MRTMLLHFDIWAIKESLVIDSSGHASITDEIGTYWAGRNWEFLEMPSLKLSNQFFERLGLPYGYCCCWFWLLLQTGHACSSTTIRLATFAPGHLYLRSFDVINQSCDVLWINPLFPRNVKAWTYVCHSNYHVEYFWNDLYDYSIVR